MRKALLALLSRLSQTTSSDMEIPNSPAAFMQRCLMDQLDALPEGSTIEMPVDALRELYTHYKDCLDVIKDQQQLINAIVENS